MKRLFIWFEKKREQFGEWLLRKRIRLVNRRMQRARNILADQQKKLRALHEGNDPPYVVDSKKLGSIIFDKKTKELSEMQLRAAHQTLGDPLFVPRAPLVDREEEAEA